MTGSDSSLVAALEAYAPSGGELDEVWAKKVRTALDDVAEDPAQADAARAALEPTTAWTLLAWAEHAATLVSRSLDQQLLDRAVLAVCLLDDAGIDGREPLLVAGLLRRAAEESGADYEVAVAEATVRSGATGRDLLLALPWVTTRLPATHLEEGDGASRRYVRRPAVAPVAAETSTDDAEGANDDQAADPTQD